MKLDVAEQIIFAAEWMGLECEIRDDYSGRGMFGQTTAAIVLSGPLMGFVAAVAQATIDSIDPQEIIKDIRKARTDSLGSDTLIY